MDIFTPQRALFSPRTPRNPKEYHAILEQGVAYGIHHCHGSWREYSLGRRIKDPRVEGITITDARVTNDLQHATVYYTVFGETLNAEPDVKGAAAALESAKGVLRSMVGQGTGVAKGAGFELLIAGARRHSHLVGGGAGRRPPAEAGHVMVAVEHVIG